MRGVNRKRREQEILATIQVMVKQEVAHGDFSAFSPLWFIKGDILTLHERLEDVYRTHADRRSDPKRPDRRVPKDLRKEAP
jgi:hypothetical protein